MNEARPAIISPEVNQKKWTPAEKVRLKKLAGAALRLWGMVLFGGDVPLKSLKPDAFKQNPLKSDLLNS